jgi:adenine deaminase
MEQWITLDREYLLEEKGLNLMIRTGNEQKILKRTKNLYDEWEVVLFEKKMFINDEIHKESLENFVMLRL